MFLRKSGLRSTSIQRTRRPKLMRILKSRRGGCNCFVLLLMLLIWIGLLVHTFVSSLLLSSKYNNEAQTSVLGLQQQQQETTIDTTKVAHPVYGRHLIWKFEDNKDIEVVYALPKSNTLKGIVVLLHGCTHNALKFFSPSIPDCPSCLGLAEELQIVRLVLSRGYAALAITSVNQKNGCWSATNDIPRIDRAIANFKQQLPSPDYKVIAIGASSGGKMAAQLLLGNKVDAGLVMVMNLGSKLKNQLASVFSTSSRPLLYLAPMPRDKRTTLRVEQEYQYLSQYTNTSIRLDTQSCVQLSVTKEYLMERVVDMTPEYANQLIIMLEEANHLHIKSKKLVKNPTKSNWRDVLLQQKGTTETTSSIWKTFVLTPGKSPLAKALHRAWAFHEYCSEVVLPALDYFEQHLL